MATTKPFPPTPHKQTTRTKPLLFIKNPMSAKTPFKNENKIDIFTKHKSCVCSPRIAGNVEGCSQV